MSGSQASNDDVPWQFELNIQHCIWLTLQVEPRAKGGHLEGSPAAVYEYRKRGETLDVFRNAYKGTFLVAGETASHALSWGHCMC